MIVYDYKYKADTKKHLQKNVLIIIHKRNYLMKYNVACLEVTFWHTTNQSKIFCSQNNVRY